MTGAVELPPCPMLIGFDITAIAERLRDIQEGEELRIPSSDEENYFYVRRDQGMVRIIVEGTSLGSMKEFTVVFYSKTHRIHRATAGNQQIQLTMNLWEDIWTYNVRLIAFLDTSVVELEWFREELGEGDENDDLSQ